jgi:hypothetical protein
MNTWVEDEFGDVDFGDDRHSLKKERFCLLYPFEEY